MKALSEESNQTAENNRFRRKAGSLKNKILVFRKDYLHITLLLLLCTVMLLTRKTAERRFLETFQTEKEIVIVLDAGHGGEDPGKVGTQGTKEKDINLSIVQKIEVLLNEAGYKTVLTRTEDKGLYSAESKNKKRSDLQERVRIISEQTPALAISIHQNSFPNASCKGAQMFYYSESDEGKILANDLQQAFLEVLQDQNTRKAKANNEYYLLRKTSCPLVIAECGFLSSPEEEAKLSSTSYQDQIAKAVVLGIVRYLENCNTDQNNNRIHQ